MSEPCSLNADERKELLKLARQALERALSGKPLDPLKLETLTPTLREPGATFVTLTIGGELRGCVGALQAYQPLAEDVREHAIAAAIHDYRFPPVAEGELERIHIEISRLTPQQPLDYQAPEELPHRLRPGIDGLTLEYGGRRATFLPQVWEKLPDPAEFLDHLCYKMGADPGLWRTHRLRALTYQVEEFHEE